jgi:hypothetical protein
MYATRLGFVLLLSATLRADILPSGSEIELRLLHPVGTRISHAGDPIEAIVIAPVMTSRGTVLITPGATLSGRVESVGRLGLGLKRARATLGLQLDTLHIPDGPNLPVHTRLGLIEAAKEKVSEDGVVGGIRPAANLSSTVSYYLVPILCLDPGFGLPVLAVKFLIARSPDSEIYFPTGTEFAVRLLDALEFAGRPGTTTETSIEPLSSSDLATARGLLAELPTQQADQGPKHPSDLLNILFLGDRGQLNRAFHAAGWVGAQEHSALTIYRMYHCMVQRTAYSAAPMGKLKLNGITSDAEYQKSLNTFSKRHHLRLWRQAESDAWFSAATEDISYRFHRGHLTHASDPHIDDERAKVVNDLAYTGCLDSAAVIERSWEFRPDPDSAASIQTDGKIAVLRLNDCLHPRSMPMAPSERPGQPNRFSEIAQAVRTDLVRSNPVSLAFNTRRMVQETPTRGLSSFRLKRSTPLPGPQLAEHQLETHKWVRSSVLDTSADGRN